MRAKIWSVGLLGMLMAWGAPESASAQFSPRARPAFGQARLRSGFMPDPQITEGRMGGPIQASQIQSGCRGYISAAPNHVISSSTGFRNLRILVHANSDSTLLVMLPNGRIVCDDDGGAGLNPIVQASVGRGRIAIWVGAYSAQAAGATYSIGYSEMGNVGTNNIPLPGQAARPVAPPPAAAGLAPQAPPAFGAVSLRSGFMPDPHLLAGTAGGPIQGNQISGGCRGYYSPQPSHVLMAPTGFRQIRFVVNGGGDTTLLVMLPDGQIVCDDDGGSGANPLVQTTSRPGSIRVWVGTYSRGRTINYNIGFSEMGSVGTNQIPAPGRGAVASPPRPGPVAPPVAAAEVVNLTVGIPTTLFGPAMTDRIVASWTPRGAGATPVTLQGANVMVGNTRIESLPSTLRDPTVTVTQRRNGNLVIRAEQPPMGRGDRGQTFLLHVAWQGRAVIVDRWSGNATQRGPRWSR
ncbi:MAG TPA: hypothetical protein ENK57_08700 [Polyangiaceae bacterium]|nr:hypothetical protein [Polyangiaceae bacterium]